ncbi:MAG TPA: DUF58 domain-containing protein [Planctomycetota bacterium]|nr:DUF58 domain-containing protein [Planctomycetota bacterium]
MPDFFDPHVIARVRGLDVRSLRLVESLMAGIHRSRLRGISTDFSQHRPYVPGDDTRHLDWKVFARTDRFYLKEYEAETNMPVRFLLDTSHSMFFQSPEAAMSKYEYAATIVATLAYLLMQQKDTFGLALFDEKVRALLPAKGSAAHFRGLVRAMSEATAGGKTSIAGALAALAPQLKHRGLVVVVSDFVADTDRFGEGLGQMSFLGQDVVLFHVEDPVEREFPFAGQTVFLGLEQEGKLVCEPRDLRRAYLAERRRHLGAIQEVCLRFGYELEDMPTDARLDVILSGFLSLRQARRRR